jgi:trigger factor
MIDAEAQRMKEQARQEMERNGQQSAMDLPLDLFREDAGRRVKLGLILAEAVKAHGLQIDEDRLRELAAEHASAYENPDEVVNFYLSDRGARASLENLALEDAVVDWVLAKVDVQDKETTFDAVM